MSLLQLHDFSVQERQGRILIEPLDLTLKENTVMALIGESGSGKTLLSRAILGLLPSHLQAQGEIWFQQKNLQKSTALDWQKIRGKQIGWVMQDTLSAFNPLLKISDQFIETLQWHLKLNRTESLHLAQQWLAKMGLGNEKCLLERYPHQLSGGQLQRVMLALTFALRPLLIIADEPTSAQDSGNREEIIELFSQMHQQYHCAMLFITHDLNAVKQIADEVAVMHKGHLIEVQTTANFFAHPQQPESLLLLQSSQKLCSSTKSTQ